MVGVSLDTGAARKSVPRVLKKLGVTYPVYQATEAAFPALFAGEEVFIPLSVLVDANGTVRPTPELAGAVQVIDTVKRRFWKHKTVSPGLHGGSKSVCVTTSPATSSASRSKAW